MEALKELFGDGQLSYAEFEKAVKGKGIELADLSGGAYVSKEKYDGKVNELTVANQSIAGLKKDLKAFEGADVEGLKKQVKDWEDKYNSDIYELKKNAAVDEAIRRENGRNAKAIKALIDMDNITLDDKGNLKGFDLSELKKSDAYLFNVKEHKNQGAGVSAGDQGGGAKAADKTDVIISKARAILGLGKDN